MTLSLLNYRFRFVNDTFNQIVFTCVLMQFVLMVHELRSPLPALVVAVVAVVTMAVSMKSSVVGVRGGIVHGLVT